MNARAEKLHAGRRYHDAAASARRAVEFAQENFGPDDQRVATSLNVLGLVHLSLGAWEPAEAAFARALSIFELTEGEINANVAASLNNLATVARSRADFARAERLFQRSIAIYEQTVGADEPRTADALNNLAALFRTQGRFAESEPLFRQAQAIRERVLGVDHPDVGQSVNNLAVLFHAQGKFSQAEPLFVRALQVTEMALGPEHPAVATRLSNLAVLYRDQGRLTDAEPLFMRALQIDEKNFGVEHFMSSATLNNLAQLYQSQEQHALAEPLLRRSLSIAERSGGPEHPSAAQAGSSLAVSLAAQGNSVEAEQLHLRALAIRQRSLGPEHRDTGNSLHDLGMFHASRAEREAALAFLERALTVRQQALGPAHPEVATTLTRLAWLHEEMGNPHLALPLQRRASAIYRERSALLGYDLAGVREAPGRISEQRRQRSIFLAHVRMLSAGNSAAAGSDETRSAEAFEALQLAKASDTGAVIAQVATRFAARDDDLAGWVRSRQDDVVRLRFLDSQLIGVLSQASDRRDRARERQLRADIASVESSIAKTDSILNARFPAYRLMTSNAPLAITDAQPLLGPDEALLAYLVDGESTFVSLVRRNQHGLIRLPLGERRLTELVKTVRQSLDLTTSGGRLRDFPLDAAHELYVGLLSLAVPLLDGVRHLVIVPDGPLQSLPFSLLVSAIQAEQQGPAGPDYAGQAWLAKSYAVSVLPAESALRAIRLQPGRTPARDPFVGFGNPVFKGDDTGVRARSALSDFYTPRGTADVRQVERLSPLPETERELRSLASRLGAPAAAVYVRAAATETRVKTLDLSRYRTLAFATHGLTAGELHGLAEPALALTPPAEASALDDGLLTASEVAQLKLNAEWVILSACNTAASDGSPGAEGLSGLARAFLYAGSRSLLVSHWPVDSVAAMRLTTYMLRNMTASGRISKAEALRRAMLELMNDPGRRRFSHPLFWAPFIVVGEGGMP